MVMNGFDFFSFIISSRTKNFKQLYILFDLKGFFSLIELICTKFKSLIFKMIIVICFIIYYFINEF